MNRTSARVGLAAIAAGELLITYLAAPVFGAQLPDRLATHWTFGGHADGSAGLAGFLLMASVLVVPAAVALVVVALSRRPRSAGVQPMIAGVAALLGAVGAGSSVLTVRANRHAADWTTVAGPGLLALVVVLATAVAVAAIAARVAVHLPTAATDLPMVAPLDLPATTAVSWSQSQSARWVVMLSAAMVAVGAALAMVVAPWWTGVLIGVSGLLVSVLAHIDVYADRRGLTVRFGPFGVPRVHLPVEQIVTASAIEVRPTQWGGWGYRGSLRVFRRAAVVLRGGPGLRLDLTGGRVFVVTVDDAATAAAVLTREIGQQAPTGAAAGR